ETLVRVGAGARDWGWPGATSMVRAHTIPNAVEGDVVEVNMEHAASREGARGSLPLNLPPTRRGIREEGSRWQRRRGTVSQGRGQRHRQDGEDSARHQSWQQEEDERLARRLQLESDTELAVAMMTAITGETAADAPSGYGRTRQGLPSIPLEWYGAMTTDPNSVPPHGLGHHHLAVTPSSGSWHQSVQASSMSEPVETRAGARSGAGAGARRGRSRRPEGGVG
ncbi:unnamed protein product, partial [Discosporangium mesarthrocarpum]